MGVRTKRYDYGAKKLAEQLKKLKKTPYIKAGFPKDSSDTKVKHAHSDDTILDIALKHEFGTEKYPERSFVRAAFKKNVKDYKRLNKREIGKLVK